MQDFKSCGAFAKHLTKLAIVGPEVIALAADKAGAVMTASARAEIGFYQSQVGPFEAWEELKPETEARKERMGYHIEAPLLATGDMQKSISYSTEGGKVVMGSTDEKMVYHEFGTHTIPPRAVIGPALYMNKERFRVGLSRTVQSWIAGLSWKREPMNNK